MSNLPPAYDAIMEDGTYDTLPQEIKDLLPTLVGLPDSVLEKAQTAMTDEAAKGQSGPTLMDEVKALADATIQVDESFERVRVGLVKVDNNDYKDKDGNPIAKFVPKWTGYQKRWTDLLWQSRDVATKTEAYVKDFLAIIIPEVEEIETNDDMADAKLDLQEFINRKDPFGDKLNASETQNNAQKFSQDFIDLRRELEEFAGTFDEFAEYQQIQLEDGIKQKNSEIEILKIEIQQCQTVVMAMGIALGVTVFATAAGAVASLAGLTCAAPFFTIGIIIAGVLAALTEFATLIAYVVKVNEKKAELREAERQLEDLKQQLEQLIELREILVNQRTDITDICGRLDRFASMWGTVSHDATLILADIEAAIGDQGSKNAFKRRIELIKVSYTNLGDSLALYATQVTKSWKMMPSSRRHYPSGPPPHPEGTDVSRLQAVVDGMYTRLYGSELLKYTTKPTGGQNHLAVFATLRLYSAKSLAADTIGGYRSFDSASSVLSELGVDRDSWTKKWQSLFEDYTKTVKTSLDVDNEGISYYSRFTHEVLDKVDWVEENFDEAKELVKKYVEDPAGEHLVSASADIAQAYIDNQRGTTQYQGDFSDFVAQARKEYDESNVRLEERIEELNAEIARSESTSQKIMNAIIAVAGVPLWMASLILGPLGFRSVAEAWAAVSQIVSRVAELSQKRYAYQEESRRNTNLKHNLENAEITFKGLKSEIVDITGHLASAAKEWGTFHHDIILIREDMEVAKDSATKRALIARLIALGTPVDTMVSEMTAYVKAVKDSGLFN